MLLIDGNNMMHREADKIGQGIHPVRFVFGKYQAPPQTTIIVWDGPYANKRRQEIYPGYKENRRPKEESKYHFFDLAKGLLRFAPVIQIECPGWEADDVIGTLINQLHGRRQMTVETNDGDYWQHSGKCRLPLVTKKWRHMSPEDCLLYKSLVGDAKDGIPGIRGFGAKSWEYLTPEDRVQIREAIKIDDLGSFMRGPSWPPKVSLNEQIFQEVRLYHKLNTYWKVPENEITEATTVGKLNLAAAEFFMEKFLL